MTFSRDTLSAFVFRCSVFLFLLRLPFGKTKIIGLWGELSCRAEALNELTNYLSPHHVFHFKTLVRTWLLIGVFCFFHHHHYIIVKNPLLHIYSINIVLGPPADPLASIKKQALLTLSQRSEHERKGQWGADRGKLNRKLMKLRKLKVSSLPWVSFQTLHLILYP